MLRDVAASATITVGLLRLRLESRNSTKSIWDAIENIYTSKYSKINQPHKCKYVKTNKFQNIVKHMDLLKKKKKKKKKHPKEPLNILYWWVGTAQQALLCHFIPLEVHYVGSTPRAKMAGMWTFSLCSRFLRHFWDVCVHLSCACGSFRTNSLLAYFPQNNAPSLVKGILTKRGMLCLSTYQVMGISELLCSAPSLVSLSVL